jgi:hypothetical protein
MLIPQQTKINRRVYCILNVDNRVHRVHAWHSTNGKRTGKNMDEITFMCISMNLFGGNSMATKIFL